MVVAEIISVVVEVVPATVVDTSPTEDMVVIIMPLTLLILLLVLLPLLKDMVLPDGKLLNPLQVMVVDRVIVRFTPLAVTTMLPVLIGDGKAVILTVCVMAAVDLLLMLLIMWTSAIRVKVTLTKNAKNTTTLKEKNCVTMNSRHITVRKDKLKEKTSVMQKLVNKKWNKLRTPIGLMNLASDIRHQRKMNSANRTMALQKPIDMCPEDDMMEGSMVVNNSSNVDLLPLSFCISKQI